MSMSKLIIHSRFWVIPNSLLNDPNISFKAKWIYAYIQSKPDDWNFSTERIANDATEWRDAVRTWIQELEKAGYLRRSQIKDERWLFEMQYELFDEPIDLSADEPSEDEPSEDNSPTDNPASNKERDTKKEIQIKRDNIFSFWNEQKIKEHKKIDSFIKHIDKRLKQFSEEEIKKAIESYSKILHNPKCYFNHKWTLWEFMQRENGMPVFLYKTEADYLSNNRSPEKQKPVTMTEKGRDNFDFFWE